MFLRLCNIYRKIARRGYFKSHLATNFTKQRSALANLHDKINEIKGISIIGHICNQSLGAALVTRDGAEIVLQAQGWNPLNY